MMELKSVGMMTFPTEWKNNPNVPNHQPGKVINVGNLIMDLPFGDGKKTYTSYL